MNSERARRLVAALELVKRMSTPELEELVEGTGTFQIVALDRLASERRDAFRAGWEECNLGPDTDTWELAYQRFIAEE